MDGRVHKVDGALATALLAPQLRSEEGDIGPRDVILCAENATGAPIVDGIDVVLSGSCATRSA